MNSDCGRLVATYLHCLQAVGLILGPGVQRIQPQQGSGAPLTPSIKIKYCISNSIQFYLQRVDFVKFGILAPKVHTHTHTHTRTHTHTHTKILRSIFSTVGRSGTAVVADLSDNQAAHTRTHARTHPRFSQILRHDAAAGADVGGEPAARRVPLGRQRRLRGLLRVLRRAQRLHKSVATAVQRNEAQHVVSHANPRCLLSGCTQATNAPVKTHILCVTTIYNLSSVCGSDEQADTGVITSPGFPENYPHSRQCEWRITVGSGRQVLLNVTSFGLESDSNCAYDFLEIRSACMTESIC